MQKSRLWMWTRQKHSLSSNLQTSTKPLHDDSWEEQAFAEDAAGPLGGFIWPPRSYSCSFCRREFRSAQALGGHMNVHRRDRARLKQSPNPDNEILHHEHPNHLNNPNSSLGFQYSPHMYTLVYNHNLNNYVHGAIPSSSTPSRVSSSTPTQENVYVKSFFPMSCSPSLIDKDKTSPRSSSSSQQNLPLPDKYCHVSDPQSDGDKNSRIVESGHSDQVDYVKPDLSMSLNLLVRRTRPASSGDEHEETIGCKRRRTDATSLRLFLKSNSVDEHDIQSEVKLSPCSIEELDLELRLGEIPKEK
ncbi:hypothetical protein K2173_001699 [Erythroxylum novogranatense]|uniref:C2H2-type domain-containing protein n=1 Tax=Erythroxylum novogranatense TaxID=1862640 RepID=A0AAV8S4R0_9ROSI|nr:hypothetical protein K2173_001699 [Erythroxylum novogranatense]